MLQFGDLLFGVRGYRLRERRGAADEIKAQIEGLPWEAQRKEAATAFQETRRRLHPLDLTVCGWPPQAADAGEDLLHADSQRLVTTVVRVLHREQEVRILKYVLKERP